VADLRRRLLRALGDRGAPSSDFDLNRDMVLPENRVLRPAAVLIAVTADGDLVLTKRSARLKHHPGQIAFPGGKQDATDATPEAAALREAEEEVGLPRESVDVLGTLPAHETVTGYSVTPVLALVPTGIVYRAEAGEVDEVFRVPLAHVTNPARFMVESRIWQGRQRHYYVVPWGPYYIWGATARILRALADRMAE
jgi:8-oxo-dGTP pyrophosphatase MutT (NUDIX family)